MDIVKVKLVNFCYLIRMFKDKTYQSAINWYYGDMKNVDRIYKESGTIYNHFYKLSFKMSSIIDNLYLGNACDASYFYKLKNADIKAIVNVTKEIPNYFEEDFHYYNISLNDQNHEKSRKVKSNVNHCIYYVFERLGHQKSDNFPIKNHQESCLQSKHVF